MGDPPAKSSSLIFLAFIRYFLKQAWDATIGERSWTSQKPYRLRFLMIPCLAFSIRLGCRLQQSIASATSGSQSWGAGSPARSLREAVSLGGFHVPYAISAHSWAGTTAFQSAFSSASVLFGKPSEAGSGAAGPHSRRAAAETSTKGKRPLCYTCKYELKRISVPQVIVSTWENCTWRERRYFVHFSNKKWKHNEAQLLCSKSHWETGEEL